METCTNTMKNKELIQFQPPRSTTLKENMRETDESDRVAIRNKNNIGLVVTSLKTHNKPFISAHNIGPPFRNICIINRTGINKRDVYALNKSRGHNVSIEFADLATGSECERYSDVIVEKPGDIALSKVTTDQLLYDYDTVGGSCDIECTARIGIPGEMDIFKSLMLVALLFFNHLCNIANGFSSLRGDGDAIVIRKSTKGNSDLLSKDALVIRRHSENSYRMCMNSTSYDAHFQLFKKWKHKIGLFATILIIFVTVVMASVGFYIYPWIVENVFSLFTGNWRNVHSSFYIMAIILFICNGTVYNFGKARIVKFKKSGGGFVYDHSSEFIYLIWTYAYPYVWMVFLPFLLFIYQYEMFTHTTAKISIAK